MTRSLFFLQFLVFSNLLWAASPIENQPPLRNQGRYPPNQIPQDESRTNISTLSPSQRNELNKSLKEKPATIQLPESTVLTQTPRKAKDNQPASPVAETAANLRRSLGQFAGGNYLLSLLYSPDTERDPGLDGIAFLYDSAIAATAMLDAGPAQYTFGVSLLKNLDTWQTRNVFVDSGRKLQLSNVMVTGVNAVTGAIQEAWSDTGPITHSAIAAFNGLSKAREIDSAGIKRGDYRPLVNVILRAADYVLAMQDPETGAVRHGGFGDPTNPKDQRFQPGIEGGAGREFGMTITAEHQPASFLVTNALSKENVPQAKRYGEAAQKILQFIVGTLWDKEANLFRGSYEPNTKIAVANYPLDVQVWTISMVGIQNLLDAKVPNKPEQRITVSNLVTLFSKIDELYGVRSFSGEIAGYSFLPNQALISPEWTWEVVAAKAEFAAFLKDNPSFANEVGVKWQDYATQAGSVSGELIKIEGARGSNGFAYAYTREGQPAIGADTLLAVRSIQPAKYIIGTAYGLSVLQGRDPVAQNGGHIKPIIKSQEFVAAFSKVLGIETETKKSSPEIPQKRGKTNPAKPAVELMNIAQMTQEYSDVNWRSRAMISKEPMSFQAGQIIVVTIEYDPKKKMTMALEGRVNPKIETGRPDVNSGIVPIVQVKPATAESLAIGRITFPFQRSFAGIKKLVFHYGATAYSGPMPGNDNSGSVEFKSVLLTYPDPQTKRRGR